MIINDNSNTITCRLCGKQCKRIYGKHLKFKHNNISTNEYKEMFPNAPLMSTSDADNTSINSGKHMSEEKYKKLFSDKFSGNKNPNHKNNTTEEQRKERSPFSKKFIKYDNINDCNNFIEKVSKIRDYTTRLNYYTSKGYNIDDAMKMLRDRQSTFSLKKCLNKYGDIEGKEIWENRQKKWLNSYKNICYSQISQELFITIYKTLLSLNFTEKVYFAKLDHNNEIHNSNKNYEYRLYLGNSYILPDFFIPSLNLIIEFDGTYYHRPTKENILKDTTRDNNIKKFGYDVIHIQEKDYRNNREKVTQNIINIILEKIK